MSSLIQTSPPDPTRWAEAAVTVVRTRQEAATDLLFVMGALGVTELVEDPCFDVGDGRRLREVASPQVTLKALFDDEDLGILKARVIGSLSEIDRDEALISVVTSTLEDKDWTQKWKEGFHPIELSPRLALCPTWEPHPPRPGQVVVTLDPGMAFGTGSHETTRSCLRLLDRLLAETTQPMDLLDIGTGSGVLSIAALLLGAGWAWGIDLDTLAVEAAQANAVTNGVQDRFRVDETPIEEIVTSFPLVVANILAGPLVELAEHIAGRVEDGGRLVLSGLLVEQADEVREAYEAQGLLHLELIPDGDWASLLLERPR